MFEGKQLTYRELNERSNQLAGTLRKKGVKADSIVGIMAERSLEMVVGIMGILKAGGAYLPIDPGYPEERIRFMLEDSGTKVILTQNDICEKTIFSGEIIYLDDESIYCGDEHNPTNKNIPGNLAYIIYTSRTTGKPKRGND